MKYIKHIITALIFTTVILSCKNQHSVKLEEVPLNEQQTFSQLAFDLQTYNAEFEIPMDTKAKGRFWKCLFRTLCADFGGALLGSQLGPVGAVLGAIISSAYSPFMWDKDESPIVNKCSLYNPGYTMSIADSIGYLHNTIIYDIYEDNPQNFGNYTLDELYDITLNRIGQYYNIDVELNKNEIIGKIQSIINTVDVNTDLDTILNEFKTITSVQNNELEIIRMYIEKISTIEDNDELVRTYNEGFTAIVNESEINGNSKGVIISTASVAGSSKLLWSVQ